MTKYKLEYIWLDGYTPTPNLRGKTQVKEFEAFPTLDQLPYWGFDGSSTMQAEGRSSDCVLKPVAIYPDPARTNGALVMCEVMMPDGVTPHPSNSRATVLDDEDAWFGFEQEYFFTITAAHSVSQSRVFLHHRALITPVLVIRMSDRSHVRLLKNISISALQLASITKALMLKWPRVSGNSRYSVKVQEALPTRSGLLAISFCVFVNSIPSISNFTASLSAIPIGMARECIVISPPNSCAKLVEKPISKL